MEDPDTDLWCRRNPITQTPEAAFVLLRGKWTPAVPPQHVRKGARLIDGGYLISSKASFPRCVLRRADDGAPFWLCENDFVPRGEIPDGSVKGQVSPLGFSVPQTEADRFCRVLRQVGPCNVRCLPRHLLFLCGINRGKRSV